MASLEITNDNKIKVNVNSSDSWSLNVNNSNFMLKKYNGIGSSTVELKTFSNVGELFGEIELFVNGKLCNNYDLKQIDNVESDFFYIIPNVINLNGKGDTKEVFIYTNDNNWDIEQLNGSDKISTAKTNNTLIITSIKDEIFYDIRIKVFSNNIDGKPYDYVTVNQTFKSYNDETINELFKVNPSYLLFTKQNEVKNVNVTTSCKEGYEVSDLNNQFSLTDNGKGKISVKYIGDGKTSATTSFNVTSCGSSKKVDVKYDNSFSSQNYLYIISSNTQYSEVTTSLVKNDENISLGVLEYELSSTSKVMVYSKPSQIVSSVSNLDDNNSCKLKIQFDNNEDFQGQIKLRNNDGIFAYINISISGYGDAKGIVFKFSDTNENTKVIESNENGEYVVKIDSYYNKNKTPLNFNVITNDFNLKGSSNLKPFKPSSSSTTLTFTAKSDIKGTKTIQLEEVETFKRLYIKINIDYGNSYYNFYFIDENNNEYYTWYLTYDYQGNLYEETPMYNKIISLSGGSLNGINKEVLFTPSGYSKEQLGVVSELTGSTNYYSSFTFTQSGSNNELTLYVTQVSAEKCNVEINYDNGSVEISTPSSIDKCFENINDFEVSLNNVSILNENCEYTYSSFTLTQGTDYELTFEPNDSNETNSTREISVSLKGKGIYNDISSSFTITQDAGPCIENTYIIEHGGDGSASYSETFCLNERTLAGHIICSTNGSYVEPIFNDILGIDEDGITIDFDTPNGTEVPFYFTLTKKPNQSTITPTFCHPNGSCVFFTITATVNECAPQELTRNCGSVKVIGRNWEITLPYAATSDLIYKFYAVNGYNSGDNINDGLDWEQEITVKKGSKTGSSRSTQYQFGTNDSRFLSVTPSEDGTYNYSDCDIKVNSDNSGDTGGDSGDDSGDDTPTEPCVTPTIKFSTTNTWGATNANSTVSNVQFCDDGVSVTRSHTFNYPSSNMGQYQTFGIDFSINDVACTIQSIEASNDSGNETTGGGSLGFSYTDINPDLILSDGSFTVSGTFVYINGQGLTKNGTYSITIYIQEV